MEKSKKSEIIITLIGVLVLAACGFMFSQKADFITNSMEVTGIVESAGSSGTGDSKEYYAIVSYELADGNVRTSRIQGSSNLKYLLKGEVLALRYAPASPDSLVIDSFWELWSTILFLGLIGFLFFLGGIGMLIKSFKG
jgi:hypothetical protein